MDELLADRGGWCLFGAIAEAAAVHGQVVWWEDGVMQVRQSAGYAKDDSVMAQIEARSDHAR